LNSDEFGEQLDEFLASPCGLLLALATRWQRSINPMLEVYLMLHVIFYFIAVQITQAQKNGKRGSKFQRNSFRFRVRNLPEIGTRSGEVRCSDKNSGVFGSMEVQLCS
jgi:hypothetical protein